MIIEYKVSQVTRYFVTRFSADDDGHSGAETKGEFESLSAAQEVANALCREEHERLGWEVGDERIKYPEPLPATDAQAEANA